MNKKKNEQKEEEVLRHQQQRRRMNKKKKNEQEELTTGAYNISHPAGDPLTYCPPATYKEKRKGRVKCLTYVGSCLPTSSLSLPRSHTQLVWNSGFSNSSGTPAITTT